MTKDRINRDTIEVELPQDEGTLRLHALHVVEGGQGGQIFVLRETVSVAGRGDGCALSLVDPSVSREHSAFMRSELGVEVRDLGSRNGTFVNGQRIDARVLLRHGDTVSLGRVQLGYVCETAEEVRRLRELYEAAVLDHLTGLYNRRFFEQRLLTEVAFAVRHRSPLSLIMVDVDRFKRVNDTHGHATGDVVLKAIASTLQREVRTEDVVARYGGEELVVVARGAGLEGAVALGERLRLRIEELVVECENVKLKSSVSAGVATLGDSTVTAGQLVRAADAALYEAKRSGRNRVVAFLAEMLTVRTGEVTVIGLPGDAPHGPPAGRAPRT